MFNCCIEDIKPVYSEFIKFKLTENIINEYASNYLQAETYEKIKEKKINVIYNFIQEKKQMAEFQYNANRYKEAFSEILNKDDFDQLIWEHKCSYCGISKEQIREFGEAGKLRNKRSDTRGYTLEVDRKNPNKEYSLDNICMSCYWCNNAKTDEFLPYEFKEIARAINKVWIQRLNKDIHFPNDSNIWKDNI